MTGNHEAFQKAMNAGISAAWDQAWDKAAGFYRQALEEFPDHPQALTSLALALYEMQDYDGALDIYTRAARVTPSDPVPPEKMAGLLERQGKLAEAVAACIQAAELYLKAHDADKAIENWIHVLSIQPENLTIRTRLAMVYEKLGRRKEAVSEYLAATSLLQHSGNLAKAMQLAEYALQILPGSPEAQQALTMLRTNQPLPRPIRPKAGTGPVHMADVPQLVTPAEPAVKTLDPIGEARQQALVRLAALLFDQAEEADLQTAQVPRRGLNALTSGASGGLIGQADRTRILLHLGQAVDSQTKGEDAQAANELERALELGLKDPAAYYDLGLLLAGRSPAKALRYLQDAVRNPEYAMASYLVMGGIHRASGNLVEAAVCYLQALRQADAGTVPEDQRDDLSQLYEPIIEAQRQKADPDVHKDLCESVESQLVRGDYREYLMNARAQLPGQVPGALPIPLAEMLLQTHSSQVVEAISLVRSLAAQDKLASAMEEAYYALQYAPTYLPLHIQIGELLLQEGRINEVVEKYTLIAGLYGLRGETSQAIRLLQRMIQIAPMDMGVRNKLIDLLVAQGRNEDAVLQYMSLAEIYTQLAELEMARQTYAAALKLAQQAQLNRAWSVKILGQMGDIDLQRLDLRQALRVFEQIRALEPEDITTRRQLIDLDYRLNLEANALAETDSYVALLEGAGKRGQAIEFLKGMVEENPTRLEFRKRLSDVYIRNRQVAEAVEQLDAIADAFMAAGNRAAAINVVQSIIALNPVNVEEYHEVLNRLRNG